jgi:hypothetical protein
MIERGRRVSDAALRERAGRSIPSRTRSSSTRRDDRFPKGPVHSHRHGRNTWDHGDRMGVTVNDVILMYLPLFHAFGFIEGPLMSMIRGAREVLTETFDPDECLDLIARERATIIHGFDTHYQALLDAQARKPRDVSSVRTGICGTGMSSSIPIAAPRAADVRQPHDRLRDERGRHRRDVLVPRLHRGAVRGGQRLSRRRLRAADRRSGDGADQPASRARRDPRARATW